ncbi:MAG: hypothetical protein ACXVGE_23280, partial [Blastococcus sp.]
MSILAAAAVPGQTNRRGAIPSGCRPDPVTPAGQYPRVPKARPRARKSTPPVAYVPPRRAM